VTGLLPQVVRDAIENQSLLSASETYGVVALVLLLVLLVELEALRVMRSSPGRVAVLSALTWPLLLAVLLTIALRVTSLLG
jgi:hypothetical protein